MEDLQNQINLFKKEIEKLAARNSLAKTVAEDYFEPGKMEYLEQSYGAYDDSTGEFVIGFESKGTRYDGRTEQIEKIHEGAELVIVRDSMNQFNTNNFILKTLKGIDVGNMPAELCNVIAPLYDKEKLVIVSSCVSFVEPISKRSRHAKQAILFAEIKGKVVLEK